jgi:hypothetical protein
LHRSVQITTGTFSDTGHPVTWLKVYTFKLSGHLHIATGWFADPLTSGAPSPDTKIFATRNANHEM